QSIEEQKQPVPTYTKKATQIMLEPQETHQKAEKNDYTSLHIAAEKDQVDVIQQLHQQKGIPIDTFKDHHNCDYTTPLHIAVKNGQLAAVKILLELGANPHLGTLGTEGVKIRGKTPLDYANELQDDQPDKQAIIQVLENATKNTSALSTGW
ncbi:MAG: ankyrin repeat domain-containing protein, partial [Bacteroidota bacterium]